MTTWDFTADSTSVIKTLRDADPPREQSFIALSLRMVKNFIYLYEAGVYATGVAFEEIGTIDGVAPTDLQDAYDKILTIIPSAGGGGSQTLQETVTNGRTYAETTSSTDYALDVFSGSTINKFFNASITRSGFTSFLKIVRNLFTARVGVDASNYAEFKANGSSFSSAEINVAGDNGISSFKLFPPTNNGDVNFSAPLLQQSGDYGFGIQRVPVSGDFTAIIGVDYEVYDGGTIIITDPDGSTSSGGFLYYTIFCSNAIANVGGIDYPIGTLLYRYFDPVGLTWATEVINGGSTNLTITSLKTANYSIQANEFTPIDLTSGSITLTLPTSPVDGTQCGAKLSVLAGTNTVTINTGGGDVINVVGGVTTASLSVLNQVVIYQYKASVGVWYALDTSISKTYIDTQDALKKDKSLDALVLQGKTIVLFGDSYTSGSGATNAGRRYSTLFCNGLGAFESNQGVQGTTMEKRVPVNYINSPNMVDNATNIPTYVATTHGMLVLQFGLNDVGQNGANYTTANYITDAQTVLTTAISTKGWPANKILMIGTPYIGSAGYAAYAVLSGNSAPTVQRHLDFIEAQKTVATTNGTLFIDIYQLQVKNDIANTIAVDNIHPNDAGHYAIARMLLNFIGFSAMFETRVSLSTSNPWHGGLGGTFSNSPGDQTKSKFDIFNDGTNRCSFGASTNVFEYHSYTGSTHSFYINSVLSSLMSANGFRTLGLRTGYVAKTATYTVLASDYTVECTANTFTVTLPSAVTVGAGTTFNIVNSGAGTITIGTTSAQTFVNVTATPTTLTMVALGSKTVRSNGANWLLVESV